MARSEFREEQHPRDADGQFIDKVKTAAMMDKLGGRWDDASQTWRVPIAKEAELASMLEELRGGKSAVPTAVPQDRAYVFHAYHGSGHDIQAFDKSASFSPDEWVAEAYVGPGEWIYEVEIGADRVADADDVERVASEAGIDLEDFVAALYEDDLRDALIAQGYQIVRFDEAEEANLFTLVGAAVRIVGRRRVDE